MRIVLALVIAWSLQAAGLRAWVTPWLAASVAVQLFEYWAMAPFRSTAEKENRRATLFAIAAVVAMSTIHAAMATLLWMTGAPVLVTTAVLILCGGLLNNVASATDSRALFAIGAAPYLAALPVVASATLLRGDTTHLPLLGLAILLFVAAVLAVWRRMHLAKSAETLAREEAQRRLEMAELAMADRAAMAAIVSHELRTPVSAILAGAEVIRTGGRPERTGETAELIVDAGRLMTSMLDDLLDHSKIEARGMTIESRDFDLRGMVIDTLRFWEPQASAKDLGLSAPLPEITWLRGDPYRLRQILNNLISNALKFTEAGEVTLETSAVARDGRIDVDLTVRDQGAGIAPEAMERLFTPFAQGSSEVARTYGGTGLGLTVSRDLARLMGGDITARSRAGGGAAFTVSVSLQPGSPAVSDPGLYAGSAGLAQDKALRVLAVDDHEINRRTLALVLEPLGVELFTASNGTAALAALSEQSFDIVLMDVNMPGIDGNETTRRLRTSSGPNAKAPVIGFSAGTEAGQIAACLAAGMTDWLPKPLEPARLYDAINRALTVADPDNRAAPASNA